MSTVTERYPEHAKQAKVIEVARHQADFLDWLLAEGYIVGKEHAHFDADGDSYCYFEEHLSDRKKAELLAGFHGIDLKKIDAEKDQMLTDIRAANSAAN